MKNEIIEIKEEVEIGDVVLEEGDKIEVLKEGAPLVGSLVGKTIVEIKDYSESRGVVRLLFSDNTSLDIYDWAWYSY